MSYLGRRFGGDIKKSAVLAAFTFFASVSMQGDVASAGVPSTQGTAAVLQFHNAPLGGQAVNVNEVSLFSAASSSQRSIYQPQTSLSNEFGSDGNSAAVPAWLEHIPFAIAGIVSAYSSSPEVSMASYRANPPKRSKPFSGLRKRRAPFGPVEAHGWTAFAGAGNWRLYTFPSTMKAKHRFDEMWQWYYGLQVDAMRLVGMGPSDQNFFAVAELKTGFDDPMQPPQPVYAARLLIGYRW